MSLDQQFNIINEKLTQLLKQYQRVKKENEILKQKLEEEQKLFEEKTAKSKN